MDSIGVQPARRWLDADVGSIARPLPVRGRLDHRGPHGIQLDVAAQLKKIGVPVDDDRLEPPLEQMAHDAVAPIEGLRVHGIDVAHEPREICLVGMNDEVVVIAHQAVRHDGRLEPVRRLGKQLQEALSISVVHKDRLAPVATCSDVIDGSRKLDSQRSCHAPSVRAYPAPTARLSGGLIADARGVCAQGQFGGAKGKI